MGPSKYLLSSLFYALFAPAASAALGGSLVVHFGSATPPPSGYNRGGCPVRVYRWDYRCHSPVSSFGPLCRDSVNLSPIVGLFRVSKLKRGALILPPAGGSGCGRRQAYVAEAELSPVLPRHVRPCGELMHWPPCRAA